MFVGQAVGATGSELSFQTLVPGQDSGFLHTHKTHEELYIIIKGEGLYQVDGEIFPVREGTVIRVSPDGKRALKNNGQENLTMLCIQYKANAFGEADSPMTGISSRILLTGNHGDRYYAGLQGCQDCHDEILPARGRIFR